MDSDPAARESGALTRWPHGRAPYRPRLRAAGQAESSKAGCSQPTGAACAAFQPPSVTSSTVLRFDVVTRSRAITPAEPTVALRAATASVFSPVRIVAARSTDSARCHATGPRELAASGAPLSQTSTASSPVMTSRASVTVPAGTVNVRRRYRVAAGASTRGSPSGYQIQLAPLSPAAAAALACSGATTVDSTATATSAAPLARRAGVPRQECPADVAVRARAGRLVGVALADPTVRPPRRRPPSVDCRTSCLSSAERLMRILPSAGPRARQTARRCI
jgi:hypothetical protein